MDRGIAATYWADTALAHFETMASQTLPGEVGPLAERRTTPEQALADQRGDLMRSQAPRRYRLPPLTPSASIVEAIAACAPGQSPDLPAADSPAAASASQPRQEADRMSGAGETARSTRLVPALKDQD